MGSERRSADGNLPDGVVPQELVQNPNPPEQVAENRARFEEKQRELQHDREEAAQELREAQNALAEQYQASMNDPAHQAVIPEQIAHDLADPYHHHGGEGERDSEVLIHPPQDFDTAPRIPAPASPRTAEEYREPGS